MSNNVINLAVVGFFGSGSSAVTDLLKEFKGCQLALHKDERGMERPYEHKLLYTKGGLFETTTLLMYCNTAYGSDIYINSFINNMKRMYKNNFVSFGSYEKLFGDKFWKSVETYVNDIGAIRLKSGLSRTEHKKSVYFSPLMVVMQLGAKVLINRPIYKLGKANRMDKNPYYFAMPTKEQIINAGRGFIDRYFKMCYESGNKIMIYDQLIHPQHTLFVDDLFDENFRVIFVKRDPRDVYCLSKYVWGKPPRGFSSPLPEDYDEFAHFWKCITTYNEMSNKVLTVDFEDLIYKYENTKRSIMEFVGLTDDEHIHRKAFFDPDKSIKNTQLFLREDAMRRDGEELQKRIPEKFYSFPYEVKYSMNEVFDDSNEVKDKEKK